MDHVAIMSGNGFFLDAILSGKKTIESRWYKTRRTPWNNIRSGDTIYFKNTAKQVTAKAVVGKVIFFELNKKKSEEIFKKYCKDIMIDRKYFNENCKDKNYCVLIFLREAKEIKPFDIDKTGYGNACAWITINSINKIKQSPL